jgi:sarcosine oxidase subunit alpha
MSEQFRLPAGGRIDRAAPLRFTFDGASYTGYRGDTLASALLANGVRVVARSIRHGRPRGIFSAGTEEPNALVQVLAPFAEPMLTATTVELYDGLAADGLPGKGRLAGQPDPARYDAVYAHADVLVVGAGPAGLAAALAAARSGARVILADERAEPGGSLHDTAATLDGAPAAEWAGRVAGELAGLPEVRLLPRTTVAGYYDQNYLIAVERRTSHLGAAAPGQAARERVWRIRAGQVVLATGAHERPIAFAGNDLPGVMLAGAARSYVNRYAVRPGHRALVFTTDDSGYPAALDLLAGGVGVAAVVEARHQPPAGWAARCAAAGVPVLAGHAVIAADGPGRLATVDLAPLAGDDVDLAGRTRLEADLLAVCGGWNPAVHLFSQSGGTLRYDETTGAFVPDTARQAQQLAGAVTGRVTLAGCLADGVRAGQAAARAAGRAPAEVSVPDADDEPVTTPLVLPLVPYPGDGPPWAGHYVDLQRDAAAADVLRATGAGLRSVEHVKRYTTIGTAHDQGKTSGVLTTAVVARALGTAAGELGTTTFRPPYTPVAFAALAGRNRGELADPVRYTPSHDWAAAHGAAFENVGQWKRAWYFPGDGEDIEAAVARECRAAREEVAFMDASTLGKIEVTGPDAAEFLDRLYTNLMSTLKVGAIRYGVMCRADGMVFDDGTVTRLAADRFLVTTTTGNAAAVLEWMEEWLQTEWPTMRVRLTSVTEQWATIAVVGPRSRELTGRLAPGLAVDNDSFPFMTWRDAQVAGIDARVCRISFSGELAYEINVAWWHGPALWEAVASTGATPYGTETMHVLRAEKGFPIIGQDTDGTITPYDLGMSWVVSKKKKDFVGKRSLARADTTRPDRKHLVGLLPADEGRLLPEGTQLVATAPLPTPPVPMLGHVTSSYRSATLGRTFALALVSGGRDRIGQRLFAPVGDAVVPVTITEPVLYDKEGARRDG